MKRFENLIIAVLLVTLLFQAVPVSQAKAEGISSPIQNSDDATTFLIVFLNDDPSSLNGTVLITEQMQKAVEASGGFQGLAASLSALGTVQKTYAAQEISLGSMKAYRIPCQFSLMSLDLVLSVQDGALAGLVTAPFSGSADEESLTSANKAYEEYDLPLPVPSLNGELPGVLLVPTGDGPYPAVVLVHGSGPNDRDETIMAQKPFRDIAEGLAQLGIAVYRYDKRTYVFGSELSGDIYLTLKDETVDDAEAAVQLLSRQDRIDPEHIFVLGHSLGAAAVPAISSALNNAVAKACGFILMAPSARSLDQLMKDQTDYLYSLLPEISAEQQAYKDQLFSDLDQLDGIDNLPDDMQIAGAYVPYWRWLAAYDPLAEARTITVPCLLLQGDEDYQVTMEDFSLWQEAVQELGNWQLVSYPGLVHTFVKGQKTEGSSVYMNNEKVDQKVINDIADFIIQNCP